MNFDIVTNLMIGVVEYIDLVVGGNEFASGAVIAGLLGMTTYALREWPMKIINTIIKHTTTSLQLNSTNESYHQLSQYLKDKNITSQSRHLKVGNGQWGGDKGIKELGYGQQIFWWNWYTPLLISSSKEDSAANTVKEFITIKKLGRSHFLFDRLISNLKDENFDPTVTKYYKYDDNYKRFITQQKKRSLDTMALPDELITYLKNTIDAFVAKESWYSDHQIPYQLGILLYGPPGTGKTSLIKAIACYMNKDICYVQDEVSLIKAVGEVKSEIIVAEEVDTMYLTKREDTKKEGVNQDLIEMLGSATLGKLLNALDGVITNHGRIIIMTTNHESTLDPALIRPGRIDIHLRIDFVCSETFNLLIGKFFKSEHKAKTFKMENKITPVMIQNDIILGLSYEEVINKYTRSN